MVRFNKTPAVGRVRRPASARAATAAVAASAMFVMGAAPAPTSYTTWSVPIGGSPDSSNYTNLRQITPANVSQVKPAWTFSTGDDNQWMFSPIVIGRTIYGFAHQQDLVALDAATGKEIWRHAAPPGSTRMRGFNYWQSKDGRDKRLLLTGGVYVYAVNAENGEPIKSFGDNGRADMREGHDRNPADIRSFASGGAGRIFENLLILGASTGEGYESPPGDIQAFDVVTGKLAWVFHTVPRPGEFGYETNPPNGYRWIGGSNNWGDQSLDVKHGIIYLPLGSPTYDFWGGDRPGNNLYGNSIVALDARTGKRIWHYQTIHHDLWDYDLVAAPQLITIRNKGKTIEAVAQAGKSGFLYVLNRLTGEPIWPIPEKPMPVSTAPGEHASPTQPIPSAPPPFARQDFTEADINPYVLDDAEREKVRNILKTARNEGIYTPPTPGRYVVQMPGHSGGAALGGTSANPNKGMVYIVSFDGPALLKLEETQAATASNDFVTPRIAGNVGCETYCRTVPARPAGGRAAAAPAGPPTAPPIDPQLAAAGQRAFAQNCQACHGPNLQGATGPSLVGAVGRLGEQSVRDTVKRGAGQMPPITQLSDADITTVVAYMRSVPAVAPAPAPAQAQRKPPEGYPADAKRMYSGYGYASAAVSPPWSTLTAYDLNKGVIKWQIPYGSTPWLDLPKDNDFGLLQFHSPKAPVIATATGLLISATADSKLRAYNAETGKIIWSTDLPGRAMGNPAVYELDGRQYILTVARGAYVAFALPAKR